ncbi:heptahelical transmembrane protein 2-like [Solanum tuberosum]|uniref:Heptahelical transmembrane protein 2 n=1 Tax=Solanum tuberosum TaxID=4113 RepID=M1AD49_SOLTU|nr:PREDICTED: heptahelical transmembrane protein 2-like [Solanum tuberosum]
MKSMMNKGTKKSSKIEKTEITESAILKEKKMNSYKEEEKKFKRRLTKFEELPVYLQDNEFIRDYYRCEWPLKEVALSVFSWHNETLNIWTHLVGFVVFVTLTVTSLMEKTAMETLLAGFSRPAGVGRWPTMKSNGSADSFPDSYTSHISNPSFLGAYGDGYEVAIWPWFVFLGGAMICLVFSSVSHLFACHSHKFTLFFWRLDYSGISIMIICSFFAPVYYTFCCQPHWCLLYLSSITLVGILVIITLFAPALTSGTFRSFRAVLFLAMGFSGVIPAAHAVSLYFHHPQVLVALVYEITMGLLYAAGAVFYVTRFPERWKPGTFDLVGQSHQIFHVLVVAAALSHSIATLVIMDWRQGLPPCNAGILG